MQRTTLRQTRSRKRTSSFLLLAVVGVWGCSPDPDLVYVNLDAVELRASPAASAGPRFTAEPYAVEKAVPGLEETEVYFGSAEERAVEAMKVYADAQERAAQAVLERLRQAYTVEAEATVTAETREAEEEYMDWLDAAVEELYTEFLLHAEKVEPLRFQLTQIVGFPDPDPRSLKVPHESDKEAYKNFLRARALREQIIALQAEYRRKVDEKFDSLLAAHRARLAAIASTGESLRSDAIARARADADKVTRDAQAALERTALDTEARLPAVPGSSSSVNSGPVSVASVPGAEGLSETREDLEAQLDVFLKTYRYRRTRDAGLGRNATQEFVEWRRKYMAGP